MSALCPDQHQSQQDCLAERSLTLEKVLSPSSLLLPLLGSDHSWPSLPAVRLIKLDNNFSVAYRQDARAGYTYSYVVIK